MASTLTDSCEPVAPTPEDIQIADAASRKLARLLGDIDEPPQGPVTIEISARGEHEIVALPTSILMLIKNILVQMAKGNAVSILPTKYELTTQEAADVLNVSRPFLIKLLEAGSIPFRKVGSHRRVVFADVMEYKKQIDAKRMEALEELAAQAQELNMGY